MNCKKATHLFILSCLSLSVFSNEHLSNIEVLNSIPLIDGYEKPRSDEAQIQESLIDLFQSFAKRNRNSDGSLNRGTHAKGQCFDGSLKIFSAKELKENFSYSQELISRIKKGLFLKDEILKTEIRLANADGLGRKNDDGPGDVRGLSFSIHSDEINDFAGKGRLDFMMNSTPGFSNGDIKGFYEVVKAANVLVYGDFEYKPNPLYTKEIAKGLLAISGGNSDHQNITSLADIHYWSNIPYTHGMDSEGRPEEIVKYQAVPCSEYRSPDLSEKESDYLQKDIVKRAKEGTICFDLKVQFFDREKILTHKKFNKIKYHWWKTHDWIEQGGLEWPESVLPFYHLARIEIPQNSSAQDCQNRYVNTRIHSTLENLPIGSISRVRTYVEEKSRALRMEEISE
jgi:hypothetical protein